MQDEVILYRQLINPSKM